jgi:hypothetical protein
MTSGESIGAVASISVGVRVSIRVDVYVGIYVGVHVRRAQRVVTGAVDTLISVWAFDIPARVVNALSVLADLVELTLDLNAVSLDALTEAGLIAPGFGSIAAARLSGRAGFVTHTRYAFAVLAS